jgi:uncharacterized protein (TIGR03118 family)
MRWKKQLLIVGAIVIAVTATAAAAVGAVRREANLYAARALLTDVGDRSLVNGWGLAAGPTTPWWTSDNGTNSSTLYSGTGSKSPLTVSVPGGPTGIVFNGNANDFVVNQGGKSGSARFLFATEAGTVLGWSPSVNGTVALPAVDRTGQHAIYKGLATMSDRLYATDFHNGRVDVFDASFNPVPLAGGFQDKKLPKGFAPFGIQALSGNIFVTYAKQDSAKHDDVAGPGLGYVDEFTPDGQLLARVASGGRKNAPPNAPWGLALAPSSFGVFAGDVLVGNFGNGRISAYQDRGNGAWVYKGQLRLGDGTLLTLEGLWAIAFGNGAAAGPTSTLYFLAGPGDEKHGMLGAITSGG